MIKHAPFLENLQHTCSTLSKSLETCALDKLVHHILYNFFSLPLLCQEKKVT